MLVSALIDRVVRKTRRHTITTFLDGPIGPILPTVVVGSATFLSIPAVIEIDSELMSVIDIDVPNRTLTVLRGFLGTTAIDHADRAPVYVGPEFLRQDMFDLVNECIDGLYPDIYRFANADLIGSADIGYGLPAGSPKPLAIWAQSGTRDRSWKAIADWEFISHADTTDFPTGVGVSIRANIGTGSRLRVTLMAPFDRVVDETDDLETVSGLQPYMTDLPYYYTMAYVLGERENNRSQIIAGQTHQRSQDVPPFSALQTANWYRARYDQKKMEAAIRLARETRTIVKGGYGS